MSKIKIFEKPKDEFFTGYKPRYSKYFKIPETPKVTIWLYRGK
jgi:hypothetical protein